MPRLVRLQQNGTAIATDDFRPLPEASSAALPDGRLALVLEADVDPVAIAADVARASLIAIHIKAFTDGRAYSLARLLRERHGYAGELRAIGDVQRDQVLYLARCGFDSFALRDDQDPTQAIAALAELSIAYQANVREPRPLFARRLQQAGAAVGAASDR
jgi:uncharacterized protein (DUF934 family)